MILQPVDAGNALPISEDNVQCGILSKWFLHSQRAQKLLPLAMKQDNQDRNYGAHSNIPWNSGEDLQREKRDPMLKAIRYL